MQTQSLQGWIKVAARWPMEIRAMRYRVWREKKVIPEAWIAEIEKALPAVNRPGTAIPSNPPEKIGLGDLVKKVTDAFGIKPCEGCKRRRRKWNQVKVPNILRLTVPPDGLSSNEGKKTGLLPSDGP